MADREERVRMQLRARAWDVVAALPEALALERPIEEQLEAGDYVVVVSLRRRGQPPAAPPPPALSLAPLQRFLPGCWLTDLERACVAELLDAAPERRTLCLLRDAVESRLGRQVGEGTLKAVLCRMADEKVGILDNDRTARPPGYAVTDAYRDFLVWAGRARAEPEAQQVA